MRTEATLLKVFISHKTGYPESIMIPSIFLKGIHHSATNWQNQNSNSRWYYLKEDALSIMLQRILIPVFPVAVLCNWAYLLQYIIVNTVWLQVTDIGLNQHKYKWVIVEFSGIASAIQGHKVQFTRKRYRN